MLTQFYRWQIEPQGDEGACLGPPGEFVPEMERKGAALKFQCKAVSSHETLFPLVLMQAIACCRDVSELKKSELEQCCRQYSTPLQAPTLNGLVAVTLMDPPFLQGSWAQQPQWG